MSGLTTFWKSGIVGKGVIILAGFVVLCCAPLMLLGIFAPKPQARVTSAQAFATVDAGLATGVPAPKALAASTADSVIAATATLIPTIEATATVAPTATSVPPTATMAPPAVAKVGDAVEAGGVTLTVMQVERKPEMNQYMKAKDGNTYVIVEVVITTSGRDKAPYNPFYFKVKDSDGREYNAGINIADDSLKSGELVQGEKVRGTVAFEVKAEAVGLTLSYEPVVLFGGYEAIKIALE